MGGEVKIELGDSEIGHTANLKVSMEKKRYFELYIRIPSSVGKASVEVKKVYYLATPGEYCRIAKKWNDGDVVNITFN